LDFDWSLQGILTILSVYESCSAWHYGILILFQALWDFSLGNGAISEVDYDGKLREGSKYCVSSTDPSLALLFEQLG